MVVASPVVRQISSVLHQSPASVRSAELMFKLDLEIGQGRVHEFNVCYNLKYSVGVVIYGFKNLHKSEFFVLYL